MELTVVDLSCKVSQQYNEIRHHVRHLTIHECNTHTGMKRQLIKYAVSVDWTVNLVHMLAAALC